MKFLVDRCGGRRIAEWLSENGHEAVFAPSLGPDPGDEMLLEWAYKNQAILITIDTDFGAIIYTQNKPHHGVIRLPDVPTKRRIELMAMLLEEHAADLAAGPIVTMSAARIRISRREPPPQDDVQS